MVGVHVRVIQAADIMGAHPLQYTILLYLLIVCSFNLFTSYLGTRGKRSRSFYT